MKSQWIDFREVKAKVKIDQVLRLHSIELNVSDGQHVGFCPLKTHTKEQKSHCFSAHLEKGIWQCFACQASGNVLDLAVRLAGLDPENSKDVRNTALKLKKAFIDADAPRDQKLKRKASPKASEPQQEFFHSEKEKALLINEPLDFALKDLDTQHPFFGELGLTPATVEHFGLGYCSRGYHNGRICIPIHSEKGLLAYAGMEIGDTLKDMLPEPVYPAPRERNGTVYEFKRDLVVYNAQRIADPVEHLIISEHFVPVWWIHQAGMRSAVSLMGTGSDEQLRQIVSKVMLQGCITVVSGRSLESPDWAAGLVSQLAQHRKVSWAKLPEGKRLIDFCTEEIPKLVQESSSSRPVIKENQHSIKGQLMRQHITARQAIVALANQFPSLRQFSLEASSWDTDKLDRISGKLSSGELCSLQFILRVWNPYQKWQCGEFNVMSAMDTWDKAHREAFLSWASDPWWC